MQFIRVCLTIFAVCAVSICVPAAKANADVVIGFEDFRLDTGEFHGPGEFKYTETVTRWYGDTVEHVGAINVNGVEFSNRQDDFGSWSGFAISNKKDTSTAGYTNQYSAYAGSGAGGSTNYAIAYGYAETKVQGVITQEFVFDPLNELQLKRLPSIYLPANYQAQSVAITNTTYAALAMRDGDTPAKKFGGTSGNDQDFFKVSVYGIDASNHALGKSVELILASYNIPSNGGNFIVDTWKQLDLTPLAGATSLHFNVSSSDIGDFGMNTPGYFALDNLTLTAVPEPSSVLLALSAGVGFVCRYSKRAMGRTKK